MTEIPHKGGDRRCTSEFETQLWTTCHIQPMVVMGASISHFAKSSALWEQASGRPRGARTQGVLPEKTHSILALWPDVEAIQNPHE